MARICLQEDLFRVVFTEIVKKREADLNQLLHGQAKKWDYAMITLAQENFDRPRSIDNRTYCFSLDYSLFNVSLTGLPLFAVNLDLSDEYTELWRFLIGPAKMKVDGCWALNMTSGEMNALYDKLRQVYRGYIAV